MLPSWRDRLHIALCPDRVVMLRIQRGLRPHPGAKQIISCDDEYGWECALARLAGALEKEGQELRATLTDRLALADLFAEVSLRLKNEFKVPAKK